MTVLVAGIGNLFFGDDGFGGEVVRRLEEAPLPDGVRVADYGIRGIDLAYDLMEGWDLAILVDALPHGAPPGTLAVFDPDTAASPPGVDALDAHSMTPAVVLGLVRRLGGPLPRVLVLGCEPACLDPDQALQLSPPVQAAVQPAAELVRSLMPSARSPGPAVQPVAQAARRQG